MSSSSSFSLDHLPPAEKLCYVHCGLCDTVLAVGVPCSSLSKTVTVRCGHCSNLLAVNMRGLLNQLSLNNSFLSPSQRFLEEIRPQPSSLLDQQIYIQSASTVAVSKQNPKTSIVNRPPEKRQRVPSAYNRFIKEEIQRIKAVNPDISHREAFSAAAKNWAHFPHIQFGLMPDQKSKKANTRSQEWEDNILQDGFLTTSTVGLVPY